VKFSECPGRFKLSQLGVKPKKNDRHALVGQVLHEAFAQWLGRFKDKERELSLFLTPELLDSSYTAVMAKAVVDWGSAPDQVIQKELYDVKVEAYTLLNMLLNLVLTEGILSEESIAEYSFSVNISGSDQLSGYVDLLCPQDDKLTIWDFKTSKYGIETSDADQLKLYDYAISKLYGKKVATAGFFLLRQGSVVRRKFSVEETDELMKRVFDLINRLSIGDLPFISNATTCRWCQYKSACEENFYKELKSEPIPLL
jgi:hypothetical protein